MNRKAKCKNEQLVNSVWETQRIRREIRKKDKFSDIGLTQLLCTSKYILHYLQLFDNWEF